MALALAMCHCILNRRLHDERFCADWVVGFEQWRDFIADRGYTPQWAEPITGIAAAEIERLAAEVAAADGCVIFGSRGINQHTNGTQTNRVLMFLATYRQLGTPRRAYFNMTTLCRSRPTRPRSPPTVRRRACRSQPS
jgi:anaerobic selenocysteine-containing dehydrogenase